LGLPSSGVALELDPGSSAGAEELELLEEDEGSSPGYGNCFREPDAGDAAAGEFGAGAAGAASVFSPGYGKRLAALAGGAGGLWQSGLLLPFAGGEAQF
jgi:hypothetical protein